MTVSRGSNVAYVFRPLPRTRSSNALEGPYKWPTTPLEEIDDPIEMFDATCSQVEHETLEKQCNTTGTRSKTPVRTPRARERLVQLFSSDDSDGEEDEEDEDTTFSHDDDHEDIALGAPYSPVETFSASESDGSEDEQSDLSDSALDADLTEEVDLEQSTFCETTPRGPHIINDAPDSSPIQKAPQSDVMIMEDTTSDATTDAPPSPVTISSDDDESIIGGINLDEISTPQPPRCADTTPSICSRPRSCTPLWRALREENLSTI